MDWLMSINENMIRSVTLSCNHVHTLKQHKLPDVDKWVYCNVCLAYVLVVGLAIDWVFCCDDCKHHRWFGGAKLTCLTAASRHMLTFHHVVRTWENTQPEQTLEVHEPSGTPHLDLWLEEPPW